MEWLWKFYKNKSTLIIHSRKHAGDRGGRKQGKGKENEKVEKRREKYICQWNGCQKFYKNIQALKLHIRKHASEKRYQCRWKGCKERFDRKKNWNAHYQSHTGDRPLLCEPSNLVSLINHRFKEPTSCNYCSKLFDTEPDLLKHEQQCQNIIGTSSLNNQHDIESSNNGTHIDDQPLQTDSESKNNSFHQDNDYSPPVLDVVTYALLLPHYPSLLNCDYKIQ
ncbi:unnamed protein product [Cunninghamella echinulata]